MKIEFKDKELEKIILGVDPGRDKIGFAFVNYNNRELILSGIFYFNELENFINKIKIFNNLNNFKDFEEWQRENFINNFNLNKNFELIIALGDGTKSREFKDYLENNLNNKIIIVDETGTTLEARNLYWRLHKPKLLTRLLPQGMRVPERILDDLAAWAVARRAVI